MTLSLMGFWSGEYRYDIDNMPDVVFAAELRQTRNLLSGYISEPNTFDPWGGTNLSAALEGFVENMSVQFSKTYRPPGSAQHTVYYDGTASSDNKTITGTWRIIGFTGTFIMTRDDDSEPLRLVANDSAPLTA